VEEERRKTFQQMEESKRQLRDFKLRKMATMVQSVFTRRHRQLKTWGFDQVQGYAMWSRVKELKVRKHLTFLGVLKTFRAWANVVKAEV
jgi:hypothetical protein